MQFTNMSSYRCIFLLIVGLAISPLSYAEEPDDTPSLQEIKKEAQDLVRALSSYTADQRDQAIQKTRAALDNLDNRIDELETRIDKSWDKMDQAAREKARAGLKSLRQQRTQAAEWYGSLKNSSASAWGHMKQGFSSAYMDLHDAWEKSEKEFRSDE